MSHKLGQVFLIDHNVIDKIMNVASLTKEDHVLEVGCGDGILTSSLSQSCQSLTVIEIDQHCIDQTKKAVTESTNIEFIHNDVLKTPFDTLSSKKLTIVANIPYYLSAKFIQHCVIYKDCLKNIIIMVQKEFAQKLIAETGAKEHTSLSLYTQFYFDVTYLFTVSKNSFKPIPKIDSAMIQLTPKESPPFDVNEEVFFKLINTAFWGRRKQLSSAIKKSPFISYEGDVKTIQFLQQNPCVRGEKLSLADFYELYKQMENQLRIK